MKISSLFEDDELSKELLYCIKNNTPKNLEKTSWWKFLICESFRKDAIVKDFINLSWPSVIHDDPNKNIRGSIPWHKLLLDELLLEFVIPLNESINFNKIIEDYFVDKKLIKTIQEEQLKIAKKTDSEILGPKPTLVDMRKWCLSNSLSHQPNKVRQECVAVLETHEGSFTYSNIRNFLVDLSESWINRLKKGSLNIDCSNQLNNEKDDEIAEIIFSNFPKTFEEKNIEDKHLYICSYNWNFTKKSNLSTT